MVNRSSKSAHFQVKSCKFNLPSLLPLGLQAELANSGAQLRCKGSLLFLVVMSIIIIIALIHVSIMVFFIILMTIFIIFRNLQPSPHFGVCCLLGKRFFFPMSAAEQAKDKKLVHIF